MADIVKRHIDNSQSDSSLKIIFLNSGSVLAPTSCTNNRTGTIDSERGELKCGQLQIDYDIGFMAGTHVASGNKNTFNWYNEEFVNGNKICIGLKKENDKWKLAITIRSDADVRSAPANFWAEVKNESDAKQVITTGFSFKKKINQ
jgi:hypothetical protein